MRIHIGHELVFEVPQPTTILLMLYVRPEVAPALQQPEGIVVEPAVPVESFVDWFGNRAARVVAPAGTVRIRYDNVVTDRGTGPSPRSRACRSFRWRRCRPSPCATCSRAAIARWTG